MASAETNSRPKTSTASIDQNTVTRPWRCRARPVARRLRPNHGSPAGRRAARQIPASTNSERAAPARHADDQHGDAREDAEHGDPGRVEQHHRQHAAASARTPHARVNGSRRCGELSSTARPQAHSTTEHSRCRRRGTGTIEPGQDARRPPRRRRPSGAPGSFRPEACRRSRRAPAVGWRAWCGGHRDGRCTTSSTTGGCGRRGVVRGSRAVVARPRRPRADGKVDAHQSAGPAGLGGPGTRSARRAARHPAGDGQAQPGPPGRVTPSRVPNRSKTRSRSAAGTPGPSSRTSSHHRSAWHPRRPVTCHPVGRGGRRCRAG